MKILFIGGTGIISSACSQLAIERGHELHLLVRGESSTLRPPPSEARLIHADIRDQEATDKALGGEQYDAVVNFVAFTPEHIETDLALFADRAAHYIFISSASAYHKPVRSLPIRESTPLYNPHWQYSRDKMACERLLWSAYEERGFPATVVRPSHTYDKTLLPFEKPGTVLTRLLEDRPVVVHGDGTSLWTLTHHRDFAVGLLGLLGHPAARGEAFHITSDEQIPWNEVFLAVARAAGKPEPKLVHVPSDLIAREDPEWGAGLLGDKAHSVAFDNSKLKRLVPAFNPATPFHEGAREIVAFCLNNRERYPAVAAEEALLDRLIERWG